MNHLFSRYKKFVLHLLAPLGGPWAVLIIATVDAAALGIPMDPVVAYYTYTDQHRVVFYVLLASLGGAVGSLVPYLIGYQGGEALIVKRVGRQRFDKVHGWVDRYGIWALVIPAMMPPPTPFKLFVFCAGVAEMSWRRLVASIFLGRVLRFTLLSVLTIQFGPQIVSTFNKVLFRHWRPALAVLAAVVIGLVLILRRRRDVRVGEPVQIGRQ